MRARTLTTALSILGLLVAPTIAGEHKKATEKGSQTDWLAKMVAETKAHGWAGLELKKVKDEQGQIKKLKVKQVVPESPAAKSGIAAGDVIVAINGHPISKIKKCKKDLVAGKQATYTIARHKGDKWEKQDITLTLAEPPRDVLAQWIGYSLLAKLESKEKSKGTAQASK
jgi:predicted metalloprotease with PDZ domain